MTLWMGLLIGVAVAAPPVAGESNPTPRPNAEAIETVSVTLKAPRRSRVREEIPVRASEAVSVVVHGTIRCQSFDVRGLQGQSLLPPKRAPSWTGERSWTESFWVGDWQGGEMTLALGAGTFASAELTVTVHYDDGFRVAPMVTPRVWTVGEPFNLTACLARMGSVVAGESIEMSAIITTPGGEEMPVPLYDDGEHGEGATNDGIFGRSVRTTEPGRHRVTFRVRARFGDDVIEREVESIHYAVLPKERARFGGKPTFRPLDYDNDKLFNSLSIDFPLHYPKGLRVAIHARLEDVAGTVIHPGVTVMAQNMIAKRDHVISIGVDSERIVGRAVDGPFVLRDIRLWDKKADRLIGVWPDVTSQPFAISAFQPPPEAESKP